MASESWLSCIIERHLSWPTASLSILLRLKRTTASPFATRPPPPPHAPPSCLMLRWKHQHGLRHRASWKLRGDCIHGGVHRGEEEGEDGPAVAACSAVKGGEEGAEVRGGEVKGGEGEDRGAEGGKKDVVRLMAGTVRGRE